MIRISLCWESYYKTNTRKREKCPKEQDCESQSGILEGKLTLRVRSFEIIIKKLLHNSPSLSVPLEEVNYTELGKYVSRWVD